MYKYAIIPGSGKCGTTSLFYYLSSHPNICPSNIKEPCFFLDSAFADYIIVKFSQHLHDYEKLFGSKDESKLRLEASPYYLYSPGTAMRIKSILPNVKLLFTLREPISRLISSFSYLKQLGIITKDQTIGNYIDESFDNIVTGRIPNNINALLMGRYSQYLKNFYDNFNHLNILIIYFENFVKDCKKQMHEICEFLNIDHSYYDTYNFKLYNKTSGINMGTLTRYGNLLRIIINKLTYDKPAIHSILLKFKNSLEPLLSKFTLPIVKENVSIPDKQLEKLRDFYSREKDELEKITGTTVPWYQ